MYKLKMKVIVKDDNKCDIFVHIFQHLKLFSNNVNLRFDEDKLYVQGMDGSHVSVFELNITSSWFDEYNIEQNNVIGINSNILFKILNTRSQNQTICLRIEDDTFEVDLENSENKKDDFNKYFKVPTIEIDSETLQISESENDLNLTMNSKKFKSIVDQLATFGDVIHITNTNEMIHLKSESQEEGSMDIEIDLNELEGYEFAEDTEINASYSSRYIQNMTQFVKISKNVQILVTNDNPIQISYHIDGEKSDENYIRFFLAPKIQDD